MWLFSLSTSTSGTGQWAWGAGVKQDPQSAPSFTAIPAGCAKSGFQSRNLHQLWEGERERQDAARELILHPKHSGQPLQRVTSDTTCLSWWQWQEEPGDTFAMGSSQGTAALAVQPDPEPGTAWQNGNCIQAVREPRAVCRMTQSSLHSAVAWPKCQAGTCASSCLVASCPQALLSRMVATKCPQLPSLCPTQLWHTGK